MTSEYDGLKTPMISAPSIKCNMNATNYSTSIAFALTHENLPPTLTLCDAVKILPCIIFYITIYYKIALQNLSITTTKLFEQRINEVS